MSSDILIGFLVNSGAAGLAYQRRSLSFSGMIAATVLGTMLFAYGHAAWYGLLLIFFVTSSFWSKFKRNKKTHLEENVEKGSQRDAVQVAANGGLALLLLLGSMTFEHPAWWIAMVGAMAAVNADTWATELGAFSRNLPRSLLNGQPVPKGTSGAVSGLGMLASLAGGLTIGLAAWIFSEWSEHPQAWGSADVIFIGVMAGLLGSIADSIIGAIWQRRYRCGGCGQITEKRVHCGQPTEDDRGLRWMNNDAVNFLASLVGALSAVIIGYLMNI